MKNVKAAKSTVLVHQKYDSVGARQNKTLQVILRRMKASARAVALDPIINRKLEHLMSH